MINTWFKFEGKIQNVSKGITQTTQTTKEPKTIWGGETKLITGTSTCSECETDMVLIIIKLPVKYDLDSKCLSSSHN